MGITLAGDDGMVRLAAHRGPVVDRQAFEKVYPMPFSMASGSGSTILQRRVLHWPDVDADATLPLQTRRACEAAGSRALLMAPLLWGDQGIGAIFVGRAKDGPFSAKDIAMVETFAGQAVIAIQNARLFNDTQEALAQQTAIAELVKAMSRTSFQLEGLMHALIENATRLSKADKGFVYLREGEDYTMRVNHGSDAGQIDMRPLRPAMGTLVGRTALLREPVVIDDAISDPSYTWKEAQARLGFRSMLGVPMLRDGKPIGVIAMWRDEVRPFTEHDQRLVSTFADQAVIAIENARLFEQLQAKTEQLEVAGRHKSEFLANMSHELRTPLNAIIGFSEVLVEQMFGEVNAKQMEYLKDIHGSGQHLLTLINDVLDLSKIEAGHMELDLSELDLGDLLEHTLSLVRERAARNGLTLTLAVPTDLPIWVADARKVKQVLLNLLSNAVKFTPAGGSVTLAARCLSDGEQIGDGDVGTDRTVDGKGNGSARSIEISVTDTGVGIAAQDQAAVFEAFRQASGSYLRKSEGTGLGLALAQRFVELHGGRLDLRSTLGQGSTFTFTLPARTLDDT
jgi:signal transduction histidine kinase